MFLRPLLRLRTAAITTTTTTPPSSQHHAMPIPVTLARRISASAAQLRKQMPPRPKPPPEDEIEESFLKGSGPGGQKINKTSSAVQLKHLPTGIVVKSQATRSRSQNRKIARDLLAARLDELYNGAQSRTAIVGETKRKRAASAAKKSRRKYRKLAEEKEKENLAEEAEEEEEAAAAEAAEAEAAIETGSNLKVEEPAGRGGQQLPPTNNTKNQT